MSAEQDAQKPTPTDPESLCADLENTLEELRLRTHVLRWDLVFLRETLQHRKAVRDAATPPEDFEGDLEQLPPPSHDGDCPYCGTSSSEIIDEEYGVCRTHKVYWLRGPTQGSELPRLSEPDGEVWAYWKQLAGMLESFRAVKPWRRYIPDPPTPSANRGELPF